MKKNIFIIFVLMISANVFAQWEISGGMGINIANTSSVENYINDTGYSFGGDKIKAFNTTVSFFVEIDYQLNDKYQLGIEFNATKYSYTNSTLFRYEFNYNLYKPSILFYYLIPGNGYKFKLGGGLGYRFGDVEEINILTSDYKTSGFGLVAKAIGNTTLGGDLYAYIGVDLRYDFTGAIEDNGYKIINLSDNEEVNLNNLSAGIQLGITYYIY